jgi:hypothetical protein
MPFSNIILHGASTQDPNALRTSVEGGVNTLVAQLNAQANKFNAPQNAQGNIISSLGIPTKDGDAVPLGYLKQAIASATDGFYQTINRRTKPYLNVGIKPFQVVFKGAVVQGTNVTQGFSWTSNGPTGASMSGTSTASVVFAIAGFTGSNAVYDHFPLPDDWAPEGGLNLDVYWTPGTSNGTAGTWTAAVVSVASGGNFDSAVFNAAGSAVVTGTNRIVNRDTITSLDLTGMNPGDELFFRFGRSDGGANAMGLIELKFNIYRNI